MQSPTCVPQTQRARCSEFGPQGWGSLSSHQDPLDFSNSWAGLTLDASCVVTLKPGAPRFFSGSSKAQSLNRSRWCISLCRCIAKLLQTCCAQQEQSQQLVNQAKERVQCERGRRCDSQTAMWADEFLMQLTAPCLACFAPLQTMREVETVCDAQTGSGTFPTYASRRGAFQSVRSPGGLRRLGPK